MLVFSKIPFDFSVNFVHSISPSISVFWKIIKFSNARVRPFVALFRQSDRILRALTGFKTKIKNFNHFDHFCVTKCELKGYYHFVKFGDSAIWKITIFSDLGNFTQVLKDGATPPIGAMRVECLWIGSLSPNKEIRNRRPLYNIKSRFREKKMW